MRLQNRDRKQKLHFATEEGIAALPGGAERAIHTALSQSRAKRASKNGASVFSRKYILMDNAKLFLIKRRGILGVNGQISDSIPGL